MRTLGFTESVKDTGRKVKPLVGPRRGMEGKEPSLGRGMVSTQSEKQGVLRERAQTWLPSRSEPNADSSSQWLHRPLSFTLRFFLEKTAAVPILQ